MQIAILCEKKEEIMRNKKLLMTIAVMLILVFTLSFMLVACKKKGGDKNPSGDINSGENIGSGEQGGVEDPTPKPPAVPSYAKSFKKAMEYMVDTMPSEFLSMSFAGVVTLNGKRYVMSLKGNLSENDAQVALVFNPEGSDDVAFAAYIVNSKLFIQTEDGTIFNISEINTNYLASIIGKVPGVLQDAIGDTLKQYEFIINLAVDMLLNGLAPTKFITYSAENGVEKFAFDIDIQGLISPINYIVTELIPEINGISLTFVGDLLSMVPLINGKIQSTVADGKLTEFFVELYDNDPESENYKQTLIGFDSAITFSNEAIQLSLPEGLDTYESLTLGNLNADFTLSLDTDGEAFDIGKLIDSFLPSPIFGENVVMLDGNAEYSLDINISLDPNLDGLDADNNLISAVLRVGADTELIRANYLDGMLYIKAISNGVNGFGDGGINVAIPLDLKGYISQLVKLVTDAIDKALGTQFKPEVAAGAIVSTSVNEGGDVILSPSLQSAITGILKIIGFEEYIIPSGDRITVVINNEFIKAITDLAKIEPINLPIFGELVVGLFGGGIEYIELTAMEVLTFRADNFLIGKSKINEQSVLESIGNIDDYGTDVESIIKSFAFSLLNDLDVSIDLDVSTIDTTLNVTNIINNIMAAVDGSYLKLPINLDLSNYDGVFKIRIATNYNEETEVGKVLIEVVTPDGDTLISAYGEGSDTYFDLTNLGLMKFCLSNVNLFALIRGALDKNVEEDNITVDDSVALMSAHSSEIEIGNDSISAAVNSYLVVTLLRMLSIDLGIDVNLNAHLNFNGSVTATLGLGSANLGLELSLGKESESQHRIEESLQKIANGEYGEYGVYNALNAQVLVDSILEVQNLNLTLDLYNNNVDNPTHENKSRIVIRRSTAPERGTFEDIGVGLKAPYRSLVLTIYKGWNSEEKNAIIWGYIDIDGKKAHIKGTSALLSVNLIVYTVTGELVDVPIDGIDVKAMLVDALAGLFGEKPSVPDEGDGDDDIIIDDSYDGIIDVPEGALPPQKPHPGEPPVEEETPSDENANLAIDEIIRGINVSLVGNMDVDVDVNINGTYVSNMLTGLLKQVFTGMDLSSMGISGIVDIDYNNETAGVFFDSIWSKLIRPLIEAQVKQAAGNQSWIGTIVGAIASNDSIKGQVKETVQLFLPLSNVEDIDVNVSLTDGRLANISAIGSNTDSERGFGLYIFNKHADSVISWEGQEKKVYYNPTIGMNINELFVEKARKHTDGNWETESYADVTWMLKDDSSVGLAEFETLVADASIDNGYADGEYVFVGSAFGTTLEVTLNLHRSEIESIKTIEVKTMRDLPDYVTAIFADGSEQIITNVTIDYDKSRVNEENNASVDIYGETYEFTVVFEEENGFEMDKVVVNVYDCESVINDIKQSHLAKVKVNDSFYRYMVADYDFSEIESMTRQQLQRPATYQVPVTLNPGTDLERIAYLDVQFLPFTIYSIERNGLNYIETDFIEYAKGESFPDEITVVGYNGVEELRYTAEVSEWILDGVTIDLKGGQYFASAILNAGDKYREWKMEGIEVNVLSTDIVSLAEHNKTVVFDWKYYLYGGVDDAQKVLPTLLDFETSDGTIKTAVPVTINIDDIFENADALYEAMVKGKTFECPLSVDVYADNGKSIFETTIQVVFPSVSMSLVEDEITIDYAEYQQLGRDHFFQEKITIKLGEDVVTAKVTWFVDNVVFNQNGSYKAYVYIAQGTSYEQRCTVTVNITGVPSADNTPEVDNTSEVEEV